MRIPEKYFGALERRPEQKFREVTMPAYVRLSTLERTLGVDREQLRVLNPAWRPTIFNGTRLVPRGYRLRLPADTAEKWTAELLSCASAVQRAVCGAGDAAHAPRAQGRDDGGDRAALRHDGRSASREINGLSAERAACAPDAGWNCPNNCRAC